jgi:hypothetical protein
MSRGGSQECLRRFAGHSAPSKKFDKRPPCSRALFFKPELALGAALGSISGRMRAWRSKSRLAAMAGYVYGVTFS